jgi:excinuclease ABC subunit A
MVPDANLSLRQGAIAPWAKPSTSPYYTQTLEALGKHFGFKHDRRRGTTCPKRCSNAILFGTGEKITFVYDDGLRSYKTPKTFEGVIPNIERRWKETDSAWVREEIERYMSTTPARPATATGSSPRRWRSRSTAAHRRGYRMSIRKANDWFDELPATSLMTKQNRDRRAHPQGNPRAAEVPQRCRPRIPDLSRNSGTLSGGESQRIRLASQIGSGLTGVLYVLDEPSIGLHQRDNDRLLETLKHLRDLGNTVIVVEHDEDAIRTADHVVDIGPGAGVHGGEIIAQGTPGDIMANPRLLTGKYLSGEHRVRCPPSAANPTQSERAQGRRARAATT